MKLGCCYKAYPDGPVIKSLYDTKTQTVDGVPDDIIKLKDDPAIWQYVNGDGMLHPTESTWQNIANTFGMVPGAMLVIADGAYHSFVIGRTSTFAYGFDTDKNSYDYKMYDIAENKRPVLFPQEFKTIGFVKTFPEYYDWYCPVALFNVFKYEGRNCVMLQDGVIVPFDKHCDEKVNYSLFNLMALAKTGKDVYAMYQDENVVKYYYNN